MFYCVFIIAYKRTFSIKEADKLAAIILGFSLEM